MNTRPEIIPDRILCVIVNFGVGSRVLHIAREQGISGGTIFLGQGTAPPHSLLGFLELRDIRKEIVMMICSNPFADKALEVMNKKLKLHKANQGIAFTMPLTAFIGSGNRDLSDKDFPPGGVANPMYHSIFTVVDKGKGEAVMEAAAGAGAKGGTIINARGAGIHETRTLFHMDIEPEKEVVLILSEATSTKAIVKAIRRDLEIDEPGNGVIFVQPVSELYGVRE